MEKDHSLILVGNMQVGLIGLKELFDKLKNARGTPEPELKEILLKKVAQKNYIASGARKEYEDALFREFRKFLGEKVEEERNGLLQVTILGVGCYSCNKLKDDVMDVLSETGVQAALTHVSDPNTMAQYGILATPALIMNGKVKSSGRVPSKSAIKRWLQEEKR